jgi:hypothetical protein
MVIIEPIWSLLYIGRYSNGQSTRGRRIHPKSTQNKWTKLNDFKPKLSNASAGIQIQRVRVQKTYPLSSHLNWGTLGRDPGHCAFFVLRDFILGSRWCSRSLASHGGWWPEAWGVSGGVHLSRRRHGGAVEWTAPRRAVESRGRVGVGVGGGIGEVAQVNPKP